MYTPTLDTAMASIEASTSQEDSILESLGGTTTPEATINPEPELQVPSSHYSPGVSTSVEERALSLLGSGVPAESVASALGVTPARISQLLAVESFSTRVAALRYENLQKHNVRDERYDSLEDKLLERLERSLPLLIKPESILKAVTVVNGAKRRGQSTPEQVTNTQNIVNLVLPSVIADKFSVNVNNQVTKAGDQELLTMASGNLLKQVEEATAARIEHTPSEQQSESYEEQDNVQKERSES